MGRCAAGTLVATTARVLASLSCLHATTSLPWLLALVRGRTLLPGPMNDTSKSRRRLILMILVGVSAVALLVWLSANLYAYTPPQPLWTAEDLPPTPVERDNGWVLVTAAPVEADIPEQLRDLDERAPEVAWAEVRAHAKLLHELMAEPSMREASETLDLARRRPDFADSCSPGERCLTTAWLELHRLGLLRSLDLALVGDLAGASELLADLIAMDRAHLDSPRSTVSALVGLTNLREALHLADMLALQLGQAEESTPEADAALAELARAVREVEVGPGLLRTQVIAEYVFYVQMLDTLGGDDQDVLDELGVSPRSMWFYNRALTLHELNERFERRYAGVEQGDISAALGGSEASPKARSGWWLRNAGGKLFLHATMFEPESLITSFSENVAEIEATRARVLARPAVAAVAE
jgi:hypothetical protein